MVSISIFSQEDYPKPILIKGDTLILILPIQLKKINKTFLELDMEKELNNSYLNEINILKDKVIIHEDLNKNCNKNVDILIQIKSELSNQVGNLELINNKQTKKLELTKKMRNLFGVSGVIIGGIGGYFISQIQK